MAIRITSDNEKELLAARHIFGSGVLNVGKLFFERNNLPTELEVSYELQPKYSLVKDIVDKCNAKRQRLLSSIKYIVMHVSCCHNPIDVFKKQPVLTNYVVNEKQVTMTSEDKHYPYSIGTSKNDINNKNSVSIMIESDLRGRTKEESIRLAAILVKELMIKYNIPIERVVRYSDAKDHRCTGDFDNPEFWKKFLKMVKES